MTAETIPCERTLTTKDSASAVLTRMVDLAKPAKQKDDPRSRPYPLRQQTTQQIKTTPKQKQKSPNENSINRKLQRK